MKYRQTHKLKYVDSPLNRSKSKHAFSFGKQERFLQIKKFSPDKFYDMPETLDRRAALIGQGDRTDFSRRDTVDPSRYYIKSQFQQKRPILIHSSSHNKIARERSYKQLLRPNLSFINQEQNIKGGYQQQQKEIIPKRNKLRTFTEQQNRNARISEQTLKTTNKKSSQRLKSQFSEANLNNLSHKTSYAQFLQISKERSPHIRHSTTFGWQQRMKLKAERPNVGPGSFNAFSEFGYF